MNNPDRSQEGALEWYVRSINRYPLLTRDQEGELARKYREANDPKAAAALVNANLRFVVKVSHEYRGYGYRLMDLIQEGNIGLMMAVKKFDPDRGYRLISYAVWWIRAYIQNYVMRSWSLVKLGTTQAQRRLFFKLRSEREKADRENGAVGPVSVEALAARLHAAEADIVDMEGRLAARDFSLDTAIDDGSRVSHLDQLASSAANPEEVYLERQSDAFVQQRVAWVAKRFNEKERYIVDHRLLTDEPQTLQEIGDHFSISRERARQIEGNVLRKIREALADSDVGRQAA